LPVKTLPCQKQVSGQISLNVAVTNTGKQLYKVDAYVMVHIFNNNNNNNKSLKKEREGEKKETNKQSCGSLPPHA